MPDIRFRSYKPAYDQCPKYQMQTTVPTTPEATIQPSLIESDAVKWVKLK
jgi:hypothetical protein